MEDPDSVPASSVTVVAESDNSTSVRHHHQATLNSVWKGPPASRQPASLGSGIQQSHVPSMVHSPILKQPSLRVSLEAGATGDMGGGGGGAGVSSSTSTRTKKSVSIVEHQLQATKQRELRLLNLLTNTSGSDTSFSPSATASTSVANSAPAISKARSDSADLEHKSSDGGEHGRNHGARSDTSSSSKGQLWNENHTHISNTALGRNSKSAAAAWTSSRSKGEELAQSDASAGQPRPPFSTEEENERLTSATASVDSPHRFAKEGAAAATALQQHRQESVRGAAKVAKVGSGLLAAVNGVVPQPRLSSGTIESERLSDSQLSATSNGKIVQKVRTVNKDEKVRTPTKVGKSSSLLSQEAEKIAKNALTTHREVSDRSERAENVTHVGSLNMRPLAYDSDPEVGKETDVTLTDIESLKTPQWSNNYFYADNNSRKGAKKVRKSRLLTERGGQNSYVSDFGADNKFNKITWAAFVAGVPPAHTVNAMCVEGMVICFLLTHRELQLAMEVCKMCLYCADSKRGILEFSPHQQEQENHKFQPGDEGSCLVLVHPVAEEFVFVPLVGI